LRFWFTFDYFIQTFRQFQHLASLLAVVFMAAEYQIVVFAHHYPVQVLAACMQRGSDPKSHRPRNLDFFFHSKVLLPVVVKNNNITENIVLDCANEIVSSNSANRIFGDDFNWQWLELYDGKNEITVEGNCEVTLEWRCVRKVGEY
jgi:hypothetical protein